MNTLRVLITGATLLAAAAAAARDDRWNDLYDEVRAIQLRRDVPMLVLVILDGGRPVLVRTSADSGDGARAPFRWGSISKSVTALVLLEAARRTSTPLDTPVGKLLEPQPYRNPWRHDHPLRLEHLLELTTGLPELTGGEFSDNTPLPLADALERHADERVVRWPPGLQHSYSNVPPGITAAVTEELTGASFDLAARRLVFEPLGMERASYQPVPGLPGGFRADGRTGIPYWHMTFPAFGALNASPRAMSRWLEALLNDGRLDGEQAVAAASVQRMFRAEASLGARAGLEVAYGAGIYGRVRSGHLFYGHGGDADGYRSRFGLLPDAGRGYLLGINVDDPSLLRRLERIVEQALTADLTAPEHPPAADPAPGALARYAGVYYPSSARFGVSRWRAGEATRARVETADGRLRLVRDGNATVLVPVAGGAFRRERDPAVSVVFAEQDGVLYLQGELGNFVRVDPGPCPGFLPVCPAP